eukprot:COSAG02_NODE_7589_length_2945_cov_1.875264_1_plen_546_part_10
MFVCLMFVPDAVLCVCWCWQDQITACTDDDACDNMPLVFQLSPDCFGCLVANGATGEEDTAPPIAPCLSSDSTSGESMCAEDEHVVSNTCVVCALGAANAPGDDPSGADTSCQPILCAEDEYVSSHACESCPPGMTRLAGDDATQEDTLCQPILCAEDEYVSSHACESCPPGMTRPAGDDATQEDTLCQPILCAEDEYVSSHACESCPLGMTRLAGDDATQEDTLCQPILCAEDEYVSSHACESCPPGMTRPAGDDATQEDTLCQPILCAEDEHVVSHICKPCPAGTINAAGDDATQEDTTCEPILKLVASTLVPAAITDVDAFKAEVAGSSGADGTVVEITHFEQEIETAASLPGSTADYETYEQQLVFRRGVATALGIGLESVSELAVAAGGDRRRLQSSVSVSYVILISDTSLAAEVADATQDTSAFVEALVTAVNDERSPENQIDLADVSVDEPSISTDIQYEVIIQTSDSDVVESVQAELSQTSVIAAALANLGVDVDASELVVQAIVACAHPIVEGYEVTQETSLLPGDAFAVTLNCVDG